MEILKCIKNRRSIRNFKDKEIDEKIIEKLIEALIWAPSAGNLQARIFYFVFNKNIKKELAIAAFNQIFISEAYLVVVGCINKKRIESRYGKRGVSIYGICDVSAALQNMLLTAEEESLGSCWVGAFDEGKVSEILKLEKNITPIAIIPIGWPNERPKSPPRLSKEELIRFIR